MKHFENIPTEAAHPKLLPFANTTSNSRLVDRGRLITNRYLSLVNNNEIDKLIDSPIPDDDSEHDPDAEVHMVPREISKPSQDSFGSIGNKFPILYEGKIHYGARSPDELNYLLVPDYRENWDILTPEAKRAFRAVMNSNWEKAVDGRHANWNENGIKKKSSDHPLIDHLLFNIGCEIWNKVPRETDVIHSSLKGDMGFYNSKTSSRRYINPNAAAKEIFNRQNLWRPELLYGEMDSINVVFDSKELFIGDGHTTEDLRKRCRKLFNENLSKLKKMEQVQSYLLSHEISLQSIRRQEFKPHSHAIVWFLREDGLGFLERAKQEGILTFRPQDLNTSWDGEKGMWDYMVKTQNIADVYRREWSEEGIREFNNSAKEAIRTFIELHSGAWGSEKDGLGKKLLYWSHIPSKTNVINGVYSHVPLEKYKEERAKANT